MYSTQNRKNTDFLRFCDLAILRYTAVGLKLGFYALNFFVWQSVEPDAISLPAGEGEREARRKKAVA